MVKKLKKEENGVQLLRINTSALNNMKEVNRNDFIALRASKWSLKDHASSLNKGYFSLGSVKYSQYDFAEYMLTF
ncbi:MAG: hypothetical protein CM15mP23_08500 [Cryomorphaceae bacterium]|nr:MAG: hypothetical protein CM15mP23_08500 [Cryomorphaceae bacterium]